VPWPAALGDAALGTISGTVVGSGVGPAQWLILRRWLKGAGWWILAIVVGRVVGSVAAAILLWAALVLPVEFAVTGAIGGPPVGTAGDHLLASRGVVVRDLA